MSEPFDKNAVEIYFSNLRAYIDNNVNIKFLNEIKREMFYLLYKNATDVNSKILLNKLFVERTNEMLYYCNTLKSRIILSENTSRNSDPTYEEMVDFLKDEFNNELDEFDINAGIYYFASGYYDGQFSNLYRAINRSGYRPGAFERGPLNFADYEYTYLIYNIVYDLSDSDGDDWKLPRELKFEIKKSDIVKNDRGDIDVDELEERIVNYISDSTNYLVESYEYKLIKSDVIDRYDSLSIVYRALVNRFASVVFDTGGKHDELPPGEHHDLPPGIKENLKNMKNDKISIKEIKNLIDEVIAETLQQEIGAVDYNDYEPIDSKDNFAGDWLSDTKAKLKDFINHVKNDNDPDGKYADKMLKLASKVGHYIENPNVSQKEKDAINKDPEWDELLGFVHDYRMSSGGPEKMYVAESLSDKNKQLIIKWVNEMGTRKAAIRMIDSILKSRIGLGTDDLADTATFADGVDSIEEALEQNDYNGAYEMARDTAIRMIEEEGGEGLFECGSWNEAVKHPMFKEAVLTEKAPPGMEGWIKANKKRFIDQYGKKKGIGVLYATAWKMFYKGKSKRKK